MKQLTTTGVVFSLIWFGTAQAQNLLVNGNFETPPDTSLVGWSLAETVTGMPAVQVNSAEVIDFANQPMFASGEAGLWLRAFEGNLGGLNNEKINAHLSQTVTGVAGETYTLTGWSRWEPNYSGAVTTLDLLSPSGEIPSPTNSIWELAFLNGSNAVIGSPVTLDLRTVQIGDNMWRQHTLMGAAPTGTAKVRVTASATDMVFNIDPLQSGFYDNFSLTAASAPATELLTNSKLNVIPAEIFGWTLVEPVAVDNLGRGDNFADDPATPGNYGLWFKNFAGGNATALQRVAGVEGGDYTFTVSSAFNQNYPGGTGPTKPSTLTLIEMAFLDASAQVIGTPVTLDLWDAGQRNPPGPIENHPEAWKQYSVNGVAPTGTALVEVRAKAIGMMNVGLPANAAFFDDMMLTLASAGVPGDYNDDGKVDAADYIVWRKNEGTTNVLPNDPTGGTIGPAQYNTWVANFGQMSGSGSGNLLSTGAVPEPTSLVLLVGMTYGMIGARRRRSR